MGDVRIKSELRNSQCSDTYGDVDLAAMFGLQEFMSSSATEKVRNNSFSAINVENKLKRSLGQDSCEEPLPAITREAKNSGPDSSDIQAKKQKLSTKPKGVAISVKTSRDEKDPDILIQYSYLCPFCSFISAHKSSTHRHIGTAHANLEGASSKKIGEKMLFLCRLCNFNSNHRSSAGRHLKTIHKKEQQNPENNVNVESKSFSSNSHPVKSNIESQSPVQNPVQLSMPDIKTEPGVSFYPVLYR